MNKLLIIFLFLPFFSQGQIIRTYAGNGIPAYAGDGGLATAASINTSLGVCVDTNGNVFIADYNNHVVRKVAFGTNIISTVAGTGISGYSGDGGPATAARLFRPWSIRVDTLGNLFFTEHGNNVVRKIDALGIITTIAGTGVNGYTGDGGPATAATFRFPSDIAFDNVGNIYIADGNDVIRKVDLAGIVTTIAGTGIGGYNGDGIPANTAQLKNPVSIVWGNGGLYIGDNQNNRLRKINSAGIINTVAGNGTGGYTGDGGNPLSATIAGPLGLAIDRAGNIYMGSYTNHVVRKISSTVIQTIAGSGVNGYSGDGGNPLLARMSQPWHVAVDKYNNVFIADGGNSRIREVIPGCAVTIIGSTNVCVGSIISLSNTIPGGTWSSNNAAVATVDANTGVVTGVVAGTSVVNYFAPGGCSATATVTVYPLPSGISGITIVCPGATTVLSNAVSGGIWSSGALSLATVGSGNGIVTGVSAGAAVISYTMPGGCFATTTVTVNSGPGVVTGGNSVCVGSLLPLSNNIGPGTWTSSFAPVATVGASDGVVEGISGGNTVITYTISSGCFVTLTVTVSPLPLAISGVTSVCAGFSTVLSNATSGGTWSSGATSIATVNSTGAVMGNSPGIAVISYIMPGGCFATTTVTVNKTPSAITGNGLICTGQSIILSNSETGGTWSSGAGGFATVTAADGIVTGVSAGNIAITYTLSSGCFRVATVTVNAMPSPITTSSVCMGASLMLTNAVSGGAWVSGMPSVASVGLANGIVTGISPGAAIISYTVAGCTATGTVSVKAVPVVALANALILCEGDTITLGSPQPTGVTYQWNTGSVDSAINIFTPGTYILTVSQNGCTATGSVQIRHPLRLPPIRLGGDSVVCIGEEIVLHSGTADAVWSDGSRGESMSVTQQGTYFATVSNECITAGDTVTLYFNACNITFPSAFSPNGDGLNDIFRAIGSLDDFSGYSLSIYNRWGQRIYYTIHIHDGWDGTYKGEKQDGGTYFYMVTYTLSGKKSMLKGDVMLVR